MDVSEEVIRQAFALSRARGGALLSLLGDFKVWRGDLAEMRDDFPRTAQADHATQATATDRSDLADVLLMSRAIEILDSDCRTELSKAYELGGGMPTAASNRDANSNAPDRERVTACKSRLIGLYAELQTHATGPAIPAWVAEREHAAVAASHGRRRG
jgi:hypothetical protein